MQNWIKRLTLDVNGNVTARELRAGRRGHRTDPRGRRRPARALDGALYYVDLGYSDTTGQVGVSKIRRIRFISSDQPPVVVATAQPIEGPPPLAVSFSSVGTSDPEGAPLGYLWAFGDGATSTVANPAHTYLTKGTYTAQLAVSDSVNTSLSAPITLSVGNPPARSILAPARKTAPVAGARIDGTGRFPTLRVIGAAGWCRHCPRRRAAVYVPLVRQAWAALATVEVAPSPRSTS